MKAVYSSITNTFSNPARIVETHVCNSGCSTDDNHSYDSCGSSLEVFRGLISSFLFGSSRGPHGSLSEVLDRNFTSLEALLITILATALAAGLVSDNICYRSRDWSRRRSRYRCRKGSSGCSYFVVFVIVLVSCIVVALVTGFVVNLVHVRKAKESSLTSIVSLLTLVSSPEFRSWLQSLSIPSWVSSTFSLLSNGFHPIATKLLSFHW